MSFVGKEFILSLGFYVKAKEKKNQKTKISKKGKWCLCQRYSKAGCFDNKMIKKWNRVLVSAIISWGNVWFWFELRERGRMKNFWSHFLTYISSVQFSCSVMSDSLWPQESQHASPPCPSPTPGVHSNSCPSSQWCHPAISSFVVRFSSCPQSLPASESFPMSQLFAWGGQSIGISASASFLPKNTQGWSPSECTGWISLQSKGLSRFFSNTTVQKHQFFSNQLSSQSNSHIHTWPQEKP